jgi:thioredoxin reductase
MGYFLARDGRSYRILERAAGPGSFFEHLPRSRRLISFNKRHAIYSDPELLLRWDWNSLLTDDYAAPFRDFSTHLYPHADEMVEYLRVFAERYELTIDYNTRAVRVGREPDATFVVVDDHGMTHRARCLIVATGTHDPYIPPIPGIELAEGYETVSFDPESYEGQRVLVIGKGNSGFELAERILDTTALVHLASPTSLRMAWTTRHAGNVRGHYTRILDAYQLKMLHGLLDCTIESIEQREDGTFAVTVRYIHADGEQECLVYDRLIRATGFRFDASIFDEHARPQLTLHGRLPAMTSSWESVNVPGMFFIGNLMQVRDFRRASSPFIDGFRYNIRTLHHLLEERRHGCELPSEQLSAEPQTLARAVLARASRTSALWAQFAYLCDAIVVDLACGRAQYLYELPVDHVQELLGPDTEHYYTLTFNWGVWDGDVFSIDRHPDHDSADRGVFLHPILHRFSRGRVIAEHHVLEDLLGMYQGAGETGTTIRRGGADIATYHREQHELPLERFLEQQLAAIAPATSLSPVS